MPKQNPIDAETLAALLDGKLSDVDAAMVRDQLSHADQDTIDAYMDAVAVNTVLAEETSAEPVLVRHQASAPAGRSSPRWWIGAVAGLAAAVAIVLFVRVQSTDENFAPHLYATTVAADSKAGGTSAINAIRGNAASPTERIRAIRMGVLLTDIEIGVQNRRDVTQELNQVSVLLRALSGASALAATYDAFAANPGQLANSDQRFAAGNTAMKAVDESLAAAGAYLQAAAIASHAKDQNFFEQFPATQLRAVSEMKDLPDSIRANVARLIVQIDQSPRDLKVISLNADAVLRSLAN